MKSTLWGLENFTLTALWLLRTRMLTNQWFNISEAKRLTIHCDQSLALNLVHWQKLNQSLMSPRLKSKCNYSCFARVKYSAKKDLWEVSLFLHIQPRARVWKASAWRYHNKTLSRRFYQTPNRYQSWNKIWFKRNRKFNLSKFQEYSTLFGSKKIRAAHQLISSMTPRPISFFFQMTNRGKASGR